MSEFAIEVDKADLLQALDEIPDAVFDRVKAVTKITADAVAAEAGRRVARRTGQTAASIVVEETYKGDGYVVFVKRSWMPMLPRWIEYGTKFIEPRPFLHPSARLEAAMHERRVAAAIEVAIHEKGLGD